MNDRKAPHLKAAAPPERYTICDRAGKQNKIRGSGVPIPPAAFRTPGNPGNGCKAESCRRRDDNPNRQILRASRKNRSTDMVGTTPCGLHDGSEG